ncbi:Helicase loader DnaI [Dehalococcoides mccartyi]|uniref:Helicase loader DnaI n=1 Tax=Dehalococcoides mccartyi TaxID=61435 RepID=A0A328EQ67_9CHLR|nr:Helicase loader DnaI [Dehalococcoides mccartyi]
MYKYTFEKLNSLGKTDEPHSQDTFKQAYEAALDFASNPTGWLVFTGPSGAGKTHLAAAIANRRLSTGQPVLYKRASELIDDLKNLLSLTVMPVTARALIYSKMPPC